MANQKKSTCCVGAKYWCLFGGLVASPLTTVTAIAHSKSWLYSLVQGLDETCQTVQQPRPPAVVQRVRQCWLAGRSESAQNCEQLLLSSANKTTACVTTQTDQTGENQIIQLPPQYYAYCPSLRITLRYCTLHYIRLQHFIMTLSSIFTVQRRNHTTIILKVTARNTEYFVYSKWILENTKSSSSGNLSLHTNTHYRSPVVLKS